TPWPTPTPRCGPPTARWPLSSSPSMPNGDPCTPCRYWPGPTKPTASPPRWSLHGPPRT
ncbi:uncharacterized protein METZ01_LOCUS160288, partial [marine metagenome]